LQQPKKADGTAAPGIVIPFGSTIDPINNFSGVHDQALPLPHNLGASAFNSTRIGFWA
jgi:hypothetical protein